MFGGHKRTVLLVLFRARNYLGCVNSFSASSINVTASPGTSVSHLTSSRTVSIQPTAVLTTYPTPRSSGIVSAQTPPHVGNRSETRLWSATVYSSVIQVSKVTASLSVLLSTSTMSPTLPSVGSSPPPRGDEARSSR